jgi:hypothetical protein
MKHLSEEDLILIYYGEPAVPWGAQHLADCGQCKAAADSLAQTLDLCNEWKIPTPDAGFERRVWEYRIPYMRLPAAFGRRQTDAAGSRMYWWMGVAATIVILAGAFQLGRVSRAPRQPAILAGLSDQARERILEISLADHLDRAGMLLTEISNAGDFGSERGRAQDLVEEGRLMRQTLARKGDSATLTFLDEVERFLLEVSNAPDSISPAEVRELQQRIGSGSLLFKVQVIESNLRTQGQKL